MHARLVGLRPGRHLRHLHLLHGRMRMAEHVRRPEAAGAIRPAAATSRRSPSPWRRCRTAAAPDAAPRNSGRSRSNSVMIVPSSSTSAGTRCSGLMAVKAADLCASAPRSTCSVGTRDALFGEKDPAPAADWAPGRRHRASSDHPPLTMVFIARLSLLLRILRDFSRDLFAIGGVSVSVTEDREIPMPSEKPLAKRRRLAAQRVREARDRLTSTTGTGVAFDYELLRQFAENRLSASLVILLLVGTVGFLSSLWTGAVDGRRLDRRGAGDPRRHRHQVPAVSRPSRRHGMNLGAGGCASSCSISSSGSPGCST